MANLGETLQFVDDYADGAVLFTGFEEAILGITLSNHAVEEAVVAYDYHKCIDILMQDGMTEEEAVEYFDFNVIGTYAGPRTPIFIERPCVGHVQSNPFQEGL